MLTTDPSFGKIYDRFKQVMADQNCHPKIKISALTIIANFFKSMKRQGNPGAMSGSYKEIIQHSLGLSLDPNFVRLGISIEIIDHISEISEHADAKTLQ
mmetsp:Transcript_36272/g.55714  ORF Transcript_36272/g.55714 Transcript_36272/m.55714 type:complete len:99 (+) Transcript_36272:761-1057(+)